MRKSPHPSEICDLYIDESSQTKHDYLILGGLIVEHTDAPELELLISQARLPQLPQGEAKWGKVSKSKLPAYKRMVDVVFDNPNLIHFHSLVVDTRKLDHHRFNDGDRELGFSKEIYQLAMKCARLYPSKLFHLYPDYRDTNQSPDDLRLILNRGCGKKGDKRDWPFRRCHFRNSKTCSQLQLVDIFIGGLAFQINNHHRAEGASPPKIELSKYILERAKIENLHRDTAIAAPFTVWHRRLR